MKYKKRLKTCHGLEQIRETWQLNVTYMDYILEQTGGKTGKI